MGERAATASISLVRRVAASGALVGAGGMLAAIALHDLRWIEWSLLAFSGVVAAAGVGLARKSMVSQVLSRAMGWVVFAPSFLVSVVSTFGAHHVEPAAVALAAASGGALALARPMLHTKEAYAQFDPSSYRRWLLASATASAAAGITTGMIALDSLRWHDFRFQAVGLGLMGLSLLGSAIGVVRMRAWGMLLGAATSLGAILAALVARDATSVGLLLAALPGLMMTLPILLAARARARAGREGTRVRVADEVSSSYVPAHYRVSDAPSEAEEGMGDSASDAEASGTRAVARAARIA